MINIHARMEVRELPKYNCWAIMHSSNSAIICDNNYAWKTKKEAEFALEQWLELPLKSETYRIDLINARKEIATLKDKLAKTTEIANKNYNTIEHLQDKLSRRNTLVTDLRGRINNKDEWIRTAIQYIRNKEVEKGISLLTGVLEK